MKALVRIVEPFAPNIGESYGPMQYANYGLCVWEYSDGSLGPAGQLHRGPVHWINFRENVFYPEYPHPVAFTYFLHANVNATVQIVPEVRTDIRDTIIQGVAVNLLRGKGIVF